jgi:hypothetical protein
MNTSIVKKLPVLLIATAFLLSFTTVADKVNFAGSWKLNEGKSLALGILLAEEGLAFKEVAVNEKSAEVIVIAVTKDAAYTAAATVTAAEMDDQAAAAPASEAEVKKSSTETKEQTKSGTDKP